MRTAICCLLLAIATPAMAFRARPVSDLRFEDRIPNLYGAVAAASDGTDYLVLIQDVDTASTYAQVISQGVPYGPAVFIGHGYVPRYYAAQGFGSVIWTGSEYLVAWADEYTTYLSAVSRRGALLSEPRRLIGEGGGNPTIVSNGRKILVFNQYWGALVSLNGDPVGHAFEMRPGSGGPALAGYALTGTGAGFALALFGKDTRVLHFDDEGRPGSPSGTLVEGPLGPSHTYSSDHGTLASDGTYVAVIFSSHDDSSTNTLKSAIIDSTHEKIVQPPRALLPYPATIGSVLWNGSEYVAVYSFAPSKQLSLTQGMLQRISRAAEPLDDPLFLSEVPHAPTFPTVVTSIVVTSNGREYLAAMEGSFVRLPIGSTNPTAPAPLSRSLDSQEALAIARGRQDFLAVWRESDRNGKTIRASRLDAKGRYLDGTGIVIATFPDPMPPGVYSPPAISVDSDGQNWLVVWTYADQVWGSRVSAEGVVRDAKPIAISAASNAVVRWGGTSWLVAVVINNRHQMASTTVTSDGLVGPLKVFDEISADFLKFHYAQFINPVLAFDGQQFVVAVALADYSSYEAPISIVTERLAVNGDPIGGSKFVSQPEVLDNIVLSLATNGSQDLIVFESGPAYLSNFAFGVQGLLLNRGFAPAAITIAPATYTLNAVEPIACDTAWNGNEFIVAHTAKDGVVQLTHLSRFGVAGETVTLPRDSDEHMHGVAFPPSSPAAQTTLPVTDLPLGLLTEHDAYEGISRAQLAFAGDLADSQLRQPVPAAPVLLKAIGDPTGITITWQPQDRVLGFEIELRQSDGTERAMGIAAGSASSTHIPYAGLTGTTLRLRAWNTAGLSAPSSEVQITTPRVRAAAR